MAKILYVGVFLTPEARQLLISHFAPIHPEVTADHLTIKFNPTSLEIENLPIGRKVRLKVESMSHDEKGQAVLVSGFFSANKHHHITISYDRCNGGSGKYSNEMFEKTTGLVYTTVNSEELILDGVIDVFPRTTPQGELTNG